MLRRKRFLAYYTYLLTYMFPNAFLPAIRLVSKVITIHFEIINIHINHN